MGEVLFREHLVDLLDRVAGHAEQILSALEEFVDQRPAGEDLRRHAVHRRQQRLLRIAGEDLDEGDARDAHEVQLRDAVGANRGLGVDADVGDDLVRVLAIKPEGLHFADLDAVETDLAALGQTVNRAFENDVIVRIRPVERIARDPEREQGQSPGCKQHEGADQNVVGLGFHGLSHRRPATRTGEIFLDPRVGILANLIQRTNCKHLAVTQHRNPVAGCSQRVEIMGYEEYR